jgi:hypothetical protein
MSHFSPILLSTSMIWLVVLQILWLSPFFILWLSFWRFTITVVLDYFYQYLYILLTLWFAINCFFSVTWVYLHLFQQTNQVNLSIVPFESNSEETEDVCNHDFLLKDDLGMVCRICGLIQQRIEIFFWVFMEKGIEFLVQNSLINSLFVRMFQLLSLKIIFLYYFNLGFLPIASLPIDI